MHAHGKRQGHFVDVDTCVISRHCALVEPICVGYGNENFCVFMETFAGDVSVAFDCKEPSHESTALGI